PGNATADIELLRQLSLRWEGLVYRILALDYCRPQLMGQLVCKVTPCIQHNYLAYLYYIFALYPASAFLSVLLGQKQSFCRSFGPDVAVRRPEYKNPRLSPGAGYLTRGCRFSHAKNTYPNYSLLLIFSSISSGRAWRTSSPLTR